MSIFKYQDLTVWQRAMQLVKMIYHLTKKLPKAELFALSNQMRRAAVSIPSNIAEGHDRKSTKEYVNFLSIAKGSNAELRTLLQITVDIEYLKNDDIKEAMDTSEEVRKMISAIMKSLS